MTDRGAVEAALLRPALEAAVEIARTGPGDDRPAEPPASMRPFVRVRRLSETAWRGVRIAVDEDVVFRRRVAATVDDDRVGRAGRLFLDRPEGWQGELEALVDERLRLESVADELAEDRVGGRRAASAEQAARRWQERAGEAEQRIAELTARLDEVTADRARLFEELVLVRADVERLTGERARAVRELKVVEAREATRVAELKALRAVLEHGPTDVATDPSGPTPDGPDPVALAEALGVARARLDLLDAALGEIDQLLSPVSPDLTERSSGIDRAGRRRPVGIGQGLHDDGPEAARYLLGIDGVVVLVDGYNLTMRMWPELDASAQRIGLERALAALHGRTRARFVVVFDGQDVVAPRPGRTVGVEVRFTPADVEADDAIIEAVTEIDPARPVVVVSDDRRVRDGARAGGANLLSNTQLAALL